jgi:hypothetical protein
MFVQCQSWDAPFSAVLIALLHEIFVLGGESRFELLDESGKLPGIAVDDVRRDTCEDFDSLSGHERLQLMLDGFLDGVGAGV